MLHPHVQQLRTDVKLKKIIDEIGELKLPKRKNVCLHLCSSIISQQLSTKAAATIYARFLDACGGTNPKPEQILAVANEQLGAAGLSNAKVQYVKNVCTFFIEHKIADKQLFQMGNEEVIDLLTQIKGVGRWTVEMILMFTLARENVFAVDDLGIQQAMIQLYKPDALDKKQLKQQMLKRAAKWEPYQTYACLYLWRYKDGQ